MRPTHPARALVPLIGLVIGCSPAIRSHSAPEPSPLGRGLPNETATRPDPTTETGADVTDPTGDVGLRLALATALVHNPTLTGYAMAVRIREARALQAGLRVNPELSADVENVGGSGELRGVDGAETTVTLSQLVELGGKRTKRRALALHELTLAEWDYEIQRVDVLTETALAFLGVLAAQEQLALAEELVAVAEEGLDAVSRRVHAGSTSPVEASRARVELETSRIDRSADEHALHVARTRLCAAWGGTTPRFERAQGDLQEVPAPPPIDSLVARMDRSATLARWATELDRRQAALDLARADGTPSITLGAGVRHMRDIGATALVFQVGLPLPFFDRNQGATDAARVAIRQAEAERRASRVRIHAQLRIAHEALLAAEADVAALRDAALPEATAAFHSAQDAYRRGSMRFTDVLDTKRLLYELKGRHVAALVRYHTAVLDIERLTGAPLAIRTHDSGRP